MHYISDILLTEQDEQEVASTLGVFDKTHVFQ